MALSSQSLFLFGYSVGVTNPNLDFKAASGGPVLTASLGFGTYSLTSLLEAVVTAMNAADGNNTYTATADRTLAGGTQNKVAIQTSGTYLSLLFGSGPNNSTSCASLLGFNPADYTGATGYFGAQSTGTTLIPQYFGYNYSDPSEASKLFGAVNVSAAGLKEAVVFNTQYFVMVEYKYETKTNARSAWQNLFLWMIAQNPLDFTPEITNPTYFFQVTLESTSEDGKGLAYKMKEMLPIANFYETGPLKFREVLNYQVQTFTFGG